MLRFGFALVTTAALLCVSAPAQEKAQEKAAGGVTVSWWGQSFFIVTSPTGKRVAFDPHALMEYGRLDGLKADISVRVSHLHTDHNAVYVLENAKDKNLRVLNGLNGMGARTTFNMIDEKIGDIHIWSVPAYHDDREGLIRGKNTIFCVEMDRLGASATPATWARSRRRRSSRRSGRSTFSWSRAAASTRSTAWRRRRRSS